METGISTIVCPNCGANPQNHNNCEYCGSLLVRFVDKNIPIVEEKYGKKANTFDGLKEALIINLQEQEKTSGHNHIHTLIKAFPLVQTLDVTNPKSQNELVEFKLPDNTPVIVRPKYTGTDEQSLVICIRFYETTKPINRDGQIKAHVLFKQMDIFPLFSLQIDDFEYIDGNIAGKVYQYYLNFGRDIDGAASIITQYFTYCCKTISVDRLRMSYTQTSLSDEEYEMRIHSINKKKGRSKFNSYYTVILGAIFSILGVFLAIISAGDGEVMFYSLVLFAIGVFILLYAFKGLRVNFKDKKINGTDTHN